jgi:membrane protease YdiL (CAAX protease family)
VLCSLPLGLLSGLLSSPPAAVDDGAASPTVLLDYIGKLLEIYFMIAVVEEVLFRAVLQDLIERALLRISSCVAGACGQQQLPDTEQKNRGTVFVDSDIDVPASPARADDDGGGGDGESSNNDNRIWPFRWQAVLSIVLASVAFAVSHVHRHWQRHGVAPAPDRFLFALFASLCYGCVFHRTNRCTASAMTNAMVNFTWFAFFEWNPTAM